MYKTTYEIPEINLNDLKEAIKKLNKKAKKLASGIITMIVLETIRKPAYMTYHSPTHGDYVRYIGEMNFEKIQIEGDAPIIPGWSFVAMVDFQDRGISTYLLKTLPGYELPEYFKEYIAKNYNGCDHCGKNRKRNYTFVVKNEETQEYKLVGKSCLKDFTSHQNPQILANYFTELYKILTAAKDMDDYEEYCRKTNTPIDISIDEFILATVYYSKKIGFLSSKEAYGGYERPTGERVYYMLNAKSDEEKRSLQAYIQETEEDKSYSDLRDKIVNFVPTMWRGKVTSDYAHNLKSCWESGIVTAKTCNIIASVFRCYERAQNQKAEEKNVDKASNHVGTVKQRLTVGKVTCTFLKEIESYYGLTTLCKFVDESGNIFTWFKSGSCDFELDSEYTLVGTVKSHNEFRDIKETQLTRCNVS